MNCHTVELSLRVAKFYGVSLRTGIEPEAAAQLHYHSAYISRIEPFPTNQTSPTHWHPIILITVK